MKKYLFILGLVGTALFTACSSADDLVADVPSQGLTEEEKAMIVEAGMDSDVPITLGSVGSRKSGMTRTSIENDANDLFETPAGQYLGVFCLAKGKQVGAPSFLGDDVKWSAAYATSYPYANWLDSGNVPAIVSKHTASTASPIDGGYAVNYSYVQFMKNIDSTPTAKYYYYPFGNWYYYDFYAYYPRQDDANVAMNAESCTVRIEIDGSQDVIWGKAIGEDNLHNRLYALEDPSDPNSTKVYAYSSKYLRLKKEAGSDEYNVVPGLEFEHKLTQFVFSVKPHDASHAAKLDAKGFRIKALKLKNVYKKIQLVVASKDNNVTAGELSIYDTSSTGVVDITARATADDSDPFPILVANGASDTSTKEVGYAIVPYSALISGKTHNQYLVSLEMEQKDDAGNYPGDDVPDTVITLTEPNVDVDGDGNPDGFAAGHKYNITLDVYSPTQIQATATLADWESPNDTDHNQTIPVD